MARIIYLLFLITINVSISTSKQCEYEKCPDLSEPGKFFEHTMCLYSATSFGDDCGTVMFKSLNVEDERAILKRHNDLRAKVAAGNETRGRIGGQPAGIIGALEWDEQLASIAQRWANQCNDNHDKCKDIGEIRVGQNIGYGSYSGGFTTNYVDIVTSWYDEVVEFDHDLVPNFQSRENTWTTHFTQLIWANTTRVGCGGVKFITKEKMYKVHLVCNYSPRGNWIGEAVYKLGGNSVEKTPDESDLEPPPELADQPHIEPDVEVPPNEHRLRSHDNPPSPPAVHSYVTPPSNEYTRESRRHPTEQPDIQVPRIEARLKQDCKYAECRDPKAPGQYKKHTMCQYPNTNLGERCTYVQQSSLDPSEKNVILGVHNSYRRQANSDLEKHGPSRDQRRGDIGSLRWNTELADIAQRWANQCQYLHDECRNVRGIEVGQNLGEMSKATSFAQFRDIVEAWYGGMEHYGYDYPHLTWANTTDVGCGGVKYSSTDGVFKTYLVCNYLSKINVNRGPVRFRSQFQSSVVPHIKARMSPVCQYKQCTDLRTPGEHHTHTMCRYPNLRTAAECNEVEQSSLTREEKQKILDIHNEVRKQADRNMRRLRWNNRLAEVAQRWANQCRVGNDECRDLDYLTHVGQNYGMIGRKHKFAYEFVNVVNVWRNQIPSRDTKTGLNNEVNPEDGFYAQLVRANTTDVGCGGIKYIDAQGYHNTYLVCNYNPSGNRHVQFASEDHASFGAESWLP